MCRWLRELWVSRLKVAPVSPVQGYCVIYCVAGLGHYRQSGIYMEPEPQPELSVSAQDDASLRGISLDFLVDFTWEHSAWHMSTHDVVEIIKSVTADTGKPYAHLLAPEQVGPPTIFISHAWQNEFGLVVAAARKYVSNEQQRLAAKGSGEAKQQLHRTTVFVWLDVFAITQHRGEAQAHDLGRLEVRDVQRPLPHPPPSLPPLIALAAAAAC